MTSQADPPRAARPAGGYLAVLRIPGLRAVFTAHAVSMVGTVAAQVALSILVFDRTGSPLLSALVLVCSFLPYALGGTILSSIADRFPARPLLVACDLLSALCIGAMLIPGLPVAALLGLLLLTGLIAPIFAGARSASLTQLLPADLFPTGRSLLRTISQTTVLTGFALGAIAVAAVGPTWLLALDVATFALSAALIRFGTPSTPAPGARGGNTIQASREGLRYLFTTPKVRTLLLLTWAAPAFSAVPDGLAVAYAAQTGAAASAAGALFTGYAAGTVLGELAATRLTPQTRRKLLIPLLLATQLPAIAFALTPSVALAAVLLAVSGSGHAFNQAVDPLILEAADPAYRGRLFTVQTSGLMTVQGVTIALAGVIGTFVAPNVTIACAGVLGTAVVLTLARKTRTAEPPAAPAA
ncbi:MFS transporter [Kribbella sp. NPDC051770]|uniref:MFS transporter n=1 Tax=Kribbella sp. NPDC051770 TaxID=3155413 RepID=UPI00343554A9